MQFYAIFVITVIKLQVLVHTASFEEENGIENLGPPYKNIKSINDYSPVAKYNGINKKNIGNGIEIKNSNRQKVKDINPLIDSQKYPNKKTEYKKENNLYNDELLKPDIILDNTNKNTKEKNQNYQLFSSSENIKIIDKNQGNRKNLINIEKSNVQHKIKEIKDTQENRESKSKKKNFNQFNTSKTSSKSMPINESHDDHNIFAKLLKKNNKKTNLKQNFESEKTNWEPKKISIDKSQYSDKPKKIIHNNKQEDTNEMSMFGNLFDEDEDNTKENNHIPINKPLNTNILEKPPNKSNNILNKWDSNKLQNKNSNTKGPHNDSINKNPTKNVAINNIDNPYKEPTYNSNFFNNHVDNEGPNNKYDPTSPKKKTRISVKRFGKT